MAVDILSLGFKVDTAPVKNASKDLDKLGTSAKGAGSSLNKMGSDASATGKSTDVLAGSVKGLIGAYAGLAGLKAFAGIVDEQKKYTAQLKLATNSQDEFNTALSKVKDIATKAQSDIGSIATVYARLTNALKDVGTSQKTVGIITENVALALKVGGASAGEASAAMLQLSQAFASGVLRGDEFNSMAESAPNLMRALAESMGVTVGQLRQMAAEGKITGEELNKAFGDEKLNEKLQTQAKEVTTLSGAWTVFKNEFNSTIADMGEGIGVVDFMTKTMNGLANAMKSVRENILTKEERRAGFGQAFSGAFSGADFWDNKFSTNPTSKPVKNGNAIGGTGAITYGGSVSPNFGATVEVQDIREVHRLQDEQARKAKELSDKLISDAKKRNDAILKDLQDSIDEEQDMQEAKYKYEQDLLKDLEKEKELAYKKELERVNKLQAIANDNFEKAQRDNAKAEEEKLRQFEKTVEGIDQVFREGFANMVNGGKSTWHSFTKSLVTTFKTAVVDAIYKMLAQPFVVKLVASILGVTASGTASAASAAVGSSGSIFGMIKDGIGSINSNITGAIESVGAYITDGLGGIGDTIGGFIGQNSAAIANGFSYAGALFQAAQGNFTGAIGTAIGTYFGGPVGGAIGSMVGSLVSGLFGGGHVSRPKYYANTKVTNSGTSLINAYGNSDAKGTGGDVAINSSKGLGDAILAYTKAFGGTSKEFTIGTNYQSKYNTYLATIGGSTAKNGMGSDFQFKPDQAMGATALAFVTAVKKGLVTIPSYLTNVIQRSNVDLNNAIDSINTLGTVRTMMDSLKTLPPVFKSIGDAINNTLTLDKVAELQTRFNAINTYTALFYSDAEKLTYFTKQVQSQFTALNQALPESRDAFRALVDGVDTTTASGLGLFNSLVDLAPTMDAYYKALQQQADATQNVVDAMANLDINKFKTLVDYTRAQRYIENGNSTQGIPGFASGGMHSGGLRIVGENGPELEATGPARIVNNRELMNSLRNPDHGSAVLVAEIGRLRQENQAQQVAIVQATQKMAKILDKIDNQGIILSETNNSGTRIILDTRTVV